MNLWSRAADAVLLLHVAYVAFVILGLVLTLAGGWRDWQWVRNPWFRIGHLAAIGIVVLQAWAGAICPLTTLEMTLREHAGDPVYAGSFLSHWLHRLLFYDAPGRVFAVAYTAFGGLVVLSWLWVRPDPFRPRASTAGGSR